jgi:hypothetical protein
VGNVIDEAKSKFLSVIIDSPDSHVDLWPAITAEARRFPVLKNIGYEYVPRGRVLYDRNLGQSIVYLDKTLDTAGTRKIIGEFFELDQAKIMWESDPHYTTDRKDIHGKFE